MMGPGFASEVGSRVVAFLIIAGGIILGLGVGVGMALGLLL